MKKSENYETPKMKIIFVDDNIITGLSSTEVGGEGQSGYGESRTRLDLEELGY